MSGLQATPGTTVRWMWTSVTASPVSTASATTCPGTMSASASRVSRWVTLLPESELFRYLLKTSGYKYFFCGGS